MTGLLLGGASSQTNTFTTTSISSNALMGWYQSQAYTASARATGPVLSGASSGAYNAPVDEVVAPWEAGAAPSPAEDLKRTALASGAFVDPDNLGAFSDIEAPEDHKRLFALHQGLKKLWAIASEAADKTTSDYRRAFLDRRAQEGLEQVREFLSESAFESLSLALGKARTLAESEVGVAADKTEYTTPVLHDGAFDAEVAAFAGAAQFTITVKKSGADIVVPIDLAGLSGTRNLDNVADYINGELEAAGVVSRFARVKVGEENEDGVIEGDRFAFKITGVSTETLSFSADDAAPALYLAGSSGGSEDAGASAGQLTKITDLDAVAPTLAPSKRLEVDEEAGEDDGARIVAAQAIPGGGSYALVASGSQLEDAPDARGAADVVLVKYDSTGRQVWSRTLGASDDAEGFALAVTAEGDAVIGGSVEGAFGDTVARGGADAFVAKFNASGQEEWVERFGSSSDDVVSAITVDAAGRIYAAGSANGSVAGGHGGGSDGFVRAFDADGTTAWTRQYGGAGDEAAKAIEVTADGDIVVGGVEDGAGVVRKFSSANGTDPALWTYDLGDLDQGAISALAVDGNDIYIAGSARSGVDQTGAVAAHSGGARDGFVVKLADGASPTETYRTFLGTDAEDVVSDIVVADGDIYLAGRTDGALPGGGALTGTREAFAAKLDAATGALDWTTQIAGRGGKSDGAAIVIDAAGASTLDRFGLPSGALEYDTSKVVAEKTSAREGDYFYVRVDGGAKRKISIDADDTLRALSFKVSAALGAKGEGSVWKLSSGDKLRIEPKEGVSIELIAGGEGQDLLAALGLEEGVVAKPEEADDEDAVATPEFSLKLSGAFSLANLDDAQVFYDALDDAMSEVRRAYREITKDPALEEALAEQAKLSGEAPAYLTAKIANYQSALARLGG